MMRIGLHVGGQDPGAIAAQCERYGVYEVFMNPGGIGGSGERGYVLGEEIRGLVEDLASRGVTMSGAIVSPPSEDAVMGREEEVVDRICRTIRAIGEAGIDRTLFYPLDRAMHIYDFDATKPRALTPGGRGWEEILAFFRRVVGVADEAGVKLANHVWDVPLMTAIIEEVPSPNNGVTYCQGMYIVEGDPYKAVSDWGIDRIFFSHARTLVRHGPRFEDYEEVPLDQGDVDIAACMRVLHEAGYDGVIAPEHLGAAQSEDPMGDAVAYLKDVLGQL